MVFFPSLFLRFQISPTSTSESENLEQGSCSLKPTGSESSSKAKEGVGCD